MVHVGGVLSPVEGFSTSRSGTDPGLEGCHQAGCTHLRHSLVGPIWPRYGSYWAIGLPRDPFAQCCSPPKMMKNSGVMSIHVRYRP